MAVKWVPIPEFIKALDLTLPQLRVLVEGGYLIIAPRETGTTLDWSTWQVRAIDPISSATIHNPITRLKLRQRLKEARKRPPISRRRILMWLMNLEMGDGTKPLPFNRMLELEVRRIAKLKDPMRTEQAVRLLNRFRDAEAIVYGMHHAGEQMTKATIEKMEVASIMRRLVKASGLEHWKECIIRNRERAKHLKLNPPPQHFPLVYRPDPQASMPSPLVLLPAPQPPRRREADRQGSRRPRGSRRT